MTTTWITLLIPTAWATNDSSLEGEIIIENKTVCTIAAMAHNIHSPDLLISLKESHLNTQTIGLSYQAVNERHNAFIPISVSCPLGYSDEIKSVYSESLEISAQNNYITVIPHNEYPYSQTHFRLLGADKITHKNGLVKITVLPALFY